MNTQGFRCTGNSHSEGLEMDNYQAIYDAVRSRISGCDVWSVVSDAIHSSLGFGNTIALAQETISCIESNSTKPSVLYRPRLSLDGDTWITCYGDNIQEGCVGCGETPAKAMAEFDLSWSFANDRR